jgi:glycerate dehydrogenase
MRVVVLDGYTLNPGDLSWAGLKALGECSIYEHSSPGEVAPRLRDAEVAITNKTVIDRPIIEQTPGLRYIGVTATGFNIVDVEAARSRNIVVTNVPAYGTRSVAQMTWALLLELANHVGHHAETVREGRWTASRDFCYWDYPLVELSGKNFGVIGYGRIGQEAAKIARAFGMDVLALKRSGKAGVSAENGEVRFLSLDELLAQSDVVSLHCPLTPETRGLINRERLDLMKRSAFLLNTSRGPLIVEQDLADALQQERIAGAGLDVLAVEPPVHSNPLLKAPNCLVTPHISWATREARQRLMNMTVENLKGWLAGKAQNVVS